MPKKDDLPYMMGLKLRLYPNWKQEKILWKNLNASRFIYNQLLANSWTDSRIIKNKLDKRYPIPEEYWRYGKNGKVIKKSQKRPANGIVQLSYKAARHKNTMPAIKTCRKGVDTYLYYAGDMG